MFYDSDKVGADVVLEDLEVYEDMVEVLLLLEMFFTGESSVEFTRAINTIDETTWAALRNK